MRNIPLDNELPCSVCLRHKRADKFTGIIKRNLVRFLILRKQSCIIRTAPRHCLARKNGIINGIADTRMIHTVQKGKIQHPCAFVPQHIHVVFQQNALIRQRSRFIHTKHIHTAKALHGVDILDDGLLTAHAQAAPRKAGGNYHRQHFRHQPYRNGKRKRKGFQPFSARQP